MSREHRTHVCWWWASVCLCRFPLNKQLLTAIIVIYNDNNIYVVFLINLMLFIFKQHFIIRCFIYSKSDWLLKNTVCESKCSSINSAWETLLDFVRVPVITQTAPRFTLLSQSPWGIHNWPQKAGHSGVIYFIHILIQNCTFYQQQDCSGRCKGGHNCIWLCS